MGASAHGTQPVPWLPAVPVARRAAAPADVVGNIRDDFAAHDWHGFLIFRLAFADRTHRTQRDVCATRGSHPHDQQTR